MPVGNEANPFLDLNKPKTDIFIAGDFNTHHALWYGNVAINRMKPIKNSDGKAEKLVHHIHELGVTLQNTFSEFTNFPSAERYRNSISDLIFTRGHVTTITGRWSCRLEGNGNSNHALITTALYIQPPTFNARRVFRLRYWEKFDKVINTMAIAEGRWASGLDIVAMPTILNNTMQKVINAAVP